MVTTCLFNLGELKKPMLTHSTSTHRQLSFFCIDPCGWIRSSCHRYSDCLSSTVWLAPTWSAANICLLEHRASKLGAAITTWIFRLQTTFHLQYASAGTFFPVSLFFLFCFPVSLEPHSFEELTWESLWVLASMSPTVNLGLHRQWFPQCSKPLSPLLSKPLFPLIPVNAAEAVNIPLSPLRSFQGQPPTAISCISLHESFPQKTICLGLAGQEYMANPSWEESSTRGWYSPGDTGEVHVLSCSPLSPHTLEHKCPSSSAAGSGTHPFLAAFLSLIFLSLSSWWCFWNFSNKLLALNLCLRVFPGEPNLGRRKPSFSNSSYFKAFQQML